MKKLLRNSLYIGAAILGIGSLGAGGIVTKAATTPPTPTTTSASATLTPGTITISTAPGITFGTVNSSADDANYTSTGFSAPLEVADQGQATGWSVSLADNGFTSSTTGGPTLTDAKLTVGSSTAAPTVSATDKDNTSTPPTITSPLAVSSAPATVFNASAGQGVGTFEATYGPGDANLYVPAGDVGGSYSSTLTWTLSNAPA